MAWSWWLVLAFFAGMGYIFARQQSKSLSWLAIAVGLLSLWVVAVAAADIFGFGFLALFAGLIVIIAIDFRDQSLEVDEVMAKK